MIKSIKHFLLQVLFILTIIALVSGCGGGNSGGDDPGDGTPHPVLTSNGIPKFADALVDSTWTASSGLFKAFTAYAAANWGDFWPIQAISWNYNSWADICLDPNCETFKALTAPSGSVAVKMNSKGTVLTFDYQTAIDTTGAYGYQLNMYDQGTTTLREIVRHNADWTKWEQIVALNPNQEVWHIKYEKTGSDIYCAALYYLRDHLDEISVIQFWHTTNQDKISYLDVINLSQPTKKAYAFGGATNLLVADHKSTGRTWKDENITNVSIINFAELPASPAIFVDGFNGPRQTGVTTPPQGYPTSLDATKPRMNGVTVAQVVSYHIDYTTLDSNF